MVADALNGPAQRACLAGVDEAGLGPILGPLVVAGVALRGPRGIDPWDALSEVVSRARPGRKRLMVADSKRVNQGPRGAERLEQAALTFVGAWCDGLPRTLRELLERFGADLARFERCPWYGDLDLPLPRHGAAGDLELRVHVLQRALRRAQIEVLHVAARPVDAEEFNELIAETDNKAHAHFRAYSQVIAELLLRVPDGARLVADRCGGRMRYRRSLREAYPDARVRTVSESAEMSSYSIERSAGRVLVSFASRGEDRAFPTALASCLAKYVRELMVEVLNGWFGARVPELSRTAGYWVDGQRFLRDIATFAQTAALPMHRLVRAR